jgi:hypothetical protein
MVEYKRFVQNAMKILANYWVNLCILLTFEEYNWK